MNSTHYLNNTHYHPASERQEKILEARSLLAASRVRQVPDCYAPGEKERKAYQGDMVPPRDRITGLSPAFDRNNLMAQVTTVDYTEDLWNPTRVYKPGELDSHGNLKPVGLWGAILLAARGLKEWHNKRRLQKATRRLNVLELRKAEANQKYLEAMKAYDKLIEELSNG